MKMAEKMESRPMNHKTIVVVPGRSERIPSLVPSSIITSPATNGLAISIGGPHAALTELVKDFVVEYGFADHFFSGTLFGTP